MKAALLSISIILILSSGGFPSDIKGVISAIDIDNGTLEVCGVEIITREGRTTLQDRQKRPAALDNLREGDLVEIEGRFIEPAKLEATSITVAKEVVAEPIAEMEEKPAPVKKAQPEPEPVKKEVRPAIEGQAPKPSDKLKGSLQNADIKTRILIIDGIIVKLDSGAKVLGPANKAISLEKLKRGSRVECEGARLSKKEFLASSVRTLK